MDGTTTSDPDNHLPHLAPRGCCHKMGGRNLIVCIDDTSNHLGDKNTNMIELHQHILKGLGDNQRTWFNSGVETHTPPLWSLEFYKKALAHTIDLVIAWNFGQTIRDAYRWLSENYKAGDCIFLFGHSRGAFQVRALSAMIDKVGLYNTSIERWAPVHDSYNLVLKFFVFSAYWLYTYPESDKIECGQNIISKSECFKTRFSHKDVKVHFVGVWDTVASIGITRSKDMFPQTIDGMTHVCCFRQALALDERRVMFLPEYAFGDAALKREDNNCSESEVKPGEDSHTKEVWFAGTHLDIGGKNTQNIGMDLSGPPLRWMLSEAEELGLRVAPFDREFSLEGQIKIKDSLTWWWWLLELLPLKRPTYTMKKDEKLTTYKPHLGSGRIIHPGQKIDSSILLANNH